MKRLVFLIILSISTFANYDHPGSGNFFEVGYLETSAVYGYSVTTAYAVLKYQYTDFTIEGFKLDYDLISTDFFKIGPYVNFNFPAYSENDKAILNGLTRKSFLDYGALLDVSIPIGQIFLQAGKTTVIENGSIFRAAYASGVPLYKFHNNYIWLNLYLEYSKYSKSVSQYLFDIEDSEETSRRKSYGLGAITSFTQIYGLWTPLTNNFWITLTLKVEKFDENIKKTSIVTKQVDQLLMAGILFSF